MHRRPRPAGAPSFLRRLALDLTAVVVLVLCALPLVASGQSPPAVRIEAGPGALLYQGGAFTPFGAPDAPPRADLLSMELAPTGDGGYEATLTFAGRFEQAGGTSQHLVFVSLQPPDGPRQRVILRADGTAGIDVAEGDAFQPAGPAEARVDGPDVVLTVPPDVGMTADWEVQPHVFLLNEDGSGFHDHGPQVPASALTGEGEPGTVAASATGAVFQQGQPAYWQLGRPFPEGFRPVSYGLEWTEEGHVVAVATFAEPPEALGTFRGKDVLAQVVQVHLVEDPQDRFGGLFVSYDVVSGSSAVFDATDVDDQKVLGAVPVEVSGTQVRIDLGPPDGGTTAAAFLPDVPPDSGPVDASAQATSTQSGCQSPVSFGVTLQITERNLEITHQDGDVASGPADTSGPVQVSSPGGRTYDFPTIAGTVLKADHLFFGCRYTVIFTLPQPLVGQGGEPTSSPEPLETITVIGEILDENVQFNFSIYDQQGGGLTSYGPGFPFADLAGPPPVEQPTGETVEPTTEAPPDEEPPVAQPPSGQTGSDFPLLPVLGGVAGAVTVAVLAYNLTKKKGKGPCPPEEVAALMARLAAARAAAEEAQTEVDEAQNDADTFDESVEAATAMGLDQENVAAGKAERKARLEAAKKAKELADAEVKAAELALAVCRCREQVEEYQAARDEVLAAKGSTGTGLEHREAPLLQDEAAGWAKLLEAFEQTGEQVDPTRLEQMFPVSSGPDQAAAQATSARLLAAWKRYRAAKAALEACLGLPTGQGTASGGSDEPGRDPASFPPEAPPDTGAQVM